MRWLLAPLFACLVAAPARPDPALVEEGRATFIATCARCHGETGQSTAIGDIRGTSETRIRRVSNGYEQMPRMTLSEDDIRAIAAYLASLAATDP